MIFSSCFTPLAKGTIFYHNLSVRHLLPYKQFYNVQSNPLCLFSANPHQLPDGRQSPLSHLARIPMLLRTTSDQTYATALSVAGIPAMHLLPRLLLFGDRLLPLLRGQQKSNGSSFWGSQRLRGNPPLASFASKCTVSLPSILSIKHLFSAFTSCKLTTSHFQTANLKLQPFSSSP